MEGLSKLKLIQEQADERITILVGGGVRSTNAGELKNILVIYIQLVLQTVQKI